MLFNCNASEQERAHFPKEARGGTQHGEENPEQAPLRSGNGGKLMRRTVKLHVGDRGEAGLCLRYPGMAFSLHEHPTAEDGFFDPPTFLSRTGGEPFLNGASDDFPALERFDDAGAADRVHAARRVSGLENAVLRKRAERLSAGDRTAVNGEDLRPGIALREERIEHLARRVGMQEPAPVHESDVDGLAIARKHPAIAARKILSAEKKFDLVRIVRNALRYREYGGVQIEVPRFQIIQPGNVARELRAGARCVYKDTTAHQR